MTNILTIYLNWGLVLKSSKFLSYGGLLGCKHVLVIWVEISLQSNRFYGKRKRKRKQVGFMKIWNCDECVGCWQLGFFFSDHIYGDSFCQISATNKQQTVQMWWFTTPRIRKCVLIRWSPPFSISSPEMEGKKSKKRKRNKRKYVLS